MNLLLYMDQLENLNFFYNEILLIDNDLHKYGDNDEVIENKRNLYINNIIDILEEHTDLCYSKNGESFLNTILYPAINLP